MLASRNPAAHPEFDRFRGMVQLCARGDEDRAGIFPQRRPWALIYGSVLSAVLGIGLLMVSPAKPLALSQKETAA